MFARLIVNRKWMVAAVAAAILALVIGVAVGRSIIPSDPEEAGVAPGKPTLFKEPRSGISLRYPADWTRLRSRDSQVPLVAALSPATSLSLRVSTSPLTDITASTLPVVREFTDELISADHRAKLLSDPEQVELGGLPGYRYRYTYTTKDGQTGAHVHYFVFKKAQLIQLVFQSLPASGLQAAEPAYNRIAASFASS